MNKYLITGIVGIIIVTALSGCITSDNVSAAEIKMYTLQSAVDVVSYNFIMNMDISMNSGGTETSMEANVNGAVDILNHKLMMEMSTDLSASMDMNILYYIINETIFIKMDNSGTEQWMKMHFSESNITWNSFDQMYMQIDLLDLGEVERLDDEKVDNENCYVLKITPDIDKLYETIMSQQGLSLGMAQSYDITDMMKEISLVLWISKDSNFIMKAYEYMSMEMNLFEFQTDMSIGLTIKFTNYNEPVNIELPEDALDAISYLDYVSITAPA